MTTHFAPRSSRITEQEIERSSGETPHALDSPRSPVSNKRVSNSRPTSALLLPGLWSSPERISVMLLGSLRDLLRCSTHSSFSPSDGDGVEDEEEDDAMVGGGLYK